MKFVPVGEAVGVVGALEGRRVQGGAPLPPGALAAQARDNSGYQDSNLRV